MHSKVILCFILLCSVLYGQQLAEVGKKGHNQFFQLEQIPGKFYGNRVANYGSPPFDNADYYYAPIKTAPASVWYRQAGLSPDGTKIVAQKSFIDGPISRIEVVLMNADGSGEIIISPNNSGVGDIQQNGNPFWSDDGTAIGYVESHVANPNKVVKYDLATATRTYIYEPAAPQDVSNPDFLGNSTTSLVFWAYGPVGGADLFIWDGSTLANITNTANYKEYEPISNADGTKILYWSGETVAEPVNTTHTLTYSGGSWVKDLGFTPIVDSYWGYWSGRPNENIGVTVMSSKDVHIYDSTGTFLFDLTGAGYSGGGGQFNFFGSGFEGPNGEILITTNAGRMDPGRDIVVANPRTNLFVSIATGSDANPGTLNAPFASISKAVSEAASGGTINVAAGSYPEDVTINKPLTLIGTGLPSVNKFIYAASPIIITGFAASSTNEVDVEPGGSINEALDIVQTGGTINVGAGTYDAFYVDKPVTLIGSGGADINNGSPAITVAATGVTISGFTFNFDSPDFAIDVLAGPYDVTINLCDFLNTNGLSVGNGVRNQGSGTVTATHNYWGDPSGPTVSSSVCGSGCIVANTSTGSVSYSPWYIDLTHVPLMSNPVLIDPANYATGVIVTPAFSWSLPFGVGATYQLEVATDAGFTNIVYDPAGNETSPWQVDDADALDNGTIYYWRVTATVGAATSCAVGEFTTISPAVPILTNPAHLSTIAGNVVYFSWYSGVAGVQYKVELSTTSNFSSYVSGFPTAYTSLTQYNFPFNYTTLPAGTYYWRVKSYTQTGVLISISSTWQFEIPGPPTAIPSYPVGGTTVYTTSPTVYWYLNNYYYTSGVEYKVHYGTTSDLTAPFSYANTSAITTNLYSTLSGLSAGSTYYYRVEASVDGFVTSTWSLEESFVVYYSTASSVPVYQSWPIGGATVYTSTPTLYWYLGLYIPGVTFELQVDNSGAGFPSPEVNEAAVAGYYYTTGSLSDGTYWWRVRISGSTTWYGPERFEVNTTTYGGTSGAVIPYPSSPTGGMVVTTQSPTLMWFAYSIDPLEYQVIYSSNPTLSGGVLVNITAPNGGSSGWLVSNTYTLSGLTPGVTYYWQVRSRLSATPATVSNYSTVAQFTVSPGASPVVVLPANPIVGTNVNSTAATLSWVVPAQSTSVLMYDLELSKNADMSSATMINNLKQPSYRANDLESNTKYYWRVRSKTSDGAVSNYSYKGEFSTGVVTGVAEETSQLPARYELTQNYPNPFNPTTKIRYSIPEGNYVSLKVYDVLGREVATLVNEYRNAGTYNIIWNGIDDTGRKVSSGTYIYRIVAGQYTSTKKMVIIK